MGWNYLHLFQVQILFSPKEFKASKYPNISTQRRIYTLKTIKKNKYDIVKKSWNTQAMTLANIKHHKGTCCVKNVREI